MRENKTSESQRSVRHWRSGARMRCPSGLVLAVAVLLASAVSGGTLVSRNSDLLACSPDSRYLVYFKQRCCEPDEYVEGDVYIYDVQQSSSALLQERLCIRVWTTAEWSQDGRSLYFSGGDTLYRFSFASKEKRPVFSAGGDQTINFFAVSFNDSLIAVNLEVAGPEPSQEVVLIALRDLKPESIYEVPDSSLGEALVNRFCFDRECSFLYVRSLYGELFRLNLNTGKSDTLARRTERLLGIVDNRLYYTKQQSEESKLCFHDPRDDREHVLTSGKDLQVSFLGSLGEKLAVSMNRNVFLYIDTSCSGKLDLPDNGEYIYVADSIAIQQREGDLYIFKFR